MINKASRVLLLVDWMPEQGSLLLDCLRKNGLDCDIMGMNFKQSEWTPLRKIFFHWPRCLWVSLKTFIRRNDYDYILARQQITGMFLGMLKLLTFSNLPKIFILVTTIVERKNPVTEKLRRLFIALSIIKVDKMAFISNGYMRLIQKRFNLPESKVVLLSLPIDYIKNPDFSGFKSGSYLYSVGLSYRDYATLMKAARKTDQQFVVATRDAYLKGLSIPNNVKIYRNAFGETAEALMEQAAAVILPLDRTSSPAGETALLRAMCYGKPVIVTKTIVTEEYIQHGQNGFLVPWRDPDAIVEAINTIISDSTRANFIGRMARETVLNNHTMDAYAKKVIDIIGLSA